ncbi:MAG: hypothetical protein M1839_002188 [Geoglossum umbratile]|nr:MAG: hypothetical protein M1839_002188 [Geoglossum umbratile]
MRFTLQSFIFALAGLLLATGIAASPLKAENLACYYKRDADGNMVGYKRDAAGAEIACAAAAAE